MTARRAKLFVISAPSGCGKTTLCKRLLDEKTGLANSVSMTTRKARPEELRGIDYHFVSRKKFLAMIKAKKFLEYEDNFGHLYGTPRKFIDDNLKKGTPILLSIDVKGAMKVRRAYPDNSVLIFILPPSINALKARLKMRSSDSRQSITKRLGIARREMAYKDKYDYRITNDKLVNAYKCLKKIVVSELNK